MEMNCSDKNLYSGLLDLFIEIFINIKNIYVVNLNDVFKKNIIQRLKSDPVIIDTIKMLEVYDFDFNFILQRSTFGEEEISRFEQLKNNKFIILNNMMYNALHNDKIIQMNSLPKKVKIDSLPKNKKNLFKIKKEHEVQKLSEFIQSINKGNVNQFDTFIEMGCGKSYLTQVLLSQNPNYFYIGIDMKNHLIEKTEQKTSVEKNQNVYVISTFITIKSFNEVFTQEIIPILNTNHRAASNIFLFGLHSCGNLTSDTLKIFINNPSISHLAIVSCCLNLLYEYISPSAKATEEFKEYFSNVGYDNKGNFLENTLRYEYNEEIGYPLSEYVKEKYSNLFLGRSVRNAAMQKATETENVHSIFYKKMFYRTLLQSFFEMFIPELGNQYGFGKIDLDNIDTSFKDYLINVLKMLSQSSKFSKSEVIKEKINTLLDTNNASDLDNKINTFLSINHDSSKILFAVQMIRMKFQKVIEYIIALDRVIYLIENGVKNIKLINIFNEHLSTRNILIYASKNM